MIADKSINLAALYKVLFEDEKLKPYEILTFLNDDEAFILLNTS